MRDLPRGIMIWSLQTLRFVAALMVVYVHAAETAVDVTGSWGSLPFASIGIGLAGVDIFFVTSGFVIARVAQGRTPKDFLWARFVRVMPLYFVFALQQAVVA